MITVAWGVAQAEGGMFHPTEEVITLIAHFARKLSSRSLRSLARSSVRPSVWLRSPFEGSLAGSPAVENRGEELRREGRKIRSTNHTKMT